MSQNFEFIQDHKFKRILIRDYGEVNNCIKAKAYKSVLVLSGSIIEALLLEFLTSNPPTGYTKSKINKLKFIELIDLSEQIDLISKTTKDLSSVIREYRNYIHPSKELRTASDINEDKAIIASRLVNLVIGNVKDNYPKLYGNKANDVFDKLLHNTHSRKIFNHFVREMNQTELDLLYQNFISYYYSNNDVTNSSDREFVYFGIEKLEKQVSEEIIKSYVLKIETEVIDGNSIQVEKLFELFGEKLNLYPEESIDTILIYLYSCLGLCNSNATNKNLKRYTSRGIINKMNLYLSPSKPYYDTHLNVMKSIIENISDIKEDSDKWDTREAYKCLKKGLSEQEYEDFINQETLEPNIEEFTRILNDTSLSPI